MPVHQERGNVADEAKYATQIFRNFWLLKPSDSLGSATVPVASGRRLAVRFGRQTVVRCKCFWPEAKNCGRDARAPRIQWFAEYGWTSRFCGCNLKFVKCKGYKFTIQPTYKL